MRREICLVICLFAFALGCVAGRVAPLTNRERVAFGLSPTTSIERGPLPPPDVLEALRRIVKAQDHWRASHDGYATLEQLVAEQRLWPEAARGRAGEYRLSITASPGVPGPVFVARVGRWLATERGQVRYIQSVQPDP
jgi:hypothetical protein